MRVPSLEELKEKEWFYPTLAALFLHVAFIAAALFIILPGNLDVPDRSTVSFKLKDADRTPLVQRKRGASASPKALKHEEFPGRSNKDVVRALKNAPGIARTETERPDRELTREVLEKRPAERDSSRSRDLENVLAETEERQAIERVQVKQQSTDSFVRQRSAKSTRVNPFTSADLVEALKRPLMGSMIYTPKNVSIDPEEGMPGFTPTGRELGAGSGGSFDFDLGQGVGEQAGKVARYESLDDFLDIAVFTYEDPSDRQKYFMIKIFAKKGAKALEPMPKEIIFAIDSSLSIHRERLEEVKKGMTAILKDLNPQDIFNVVAFKDNTRFFKPKSIAADDEAVREAARFVSGLEPSQQTDVYQAFKRIVDLPLGRRPSNVMLISDGRPTHGIVGSREVISSVTRANDRTRPVFAFSGGAKVNRYLLDFISYQNRAWSQYIKDTRDIDRGLAEFYAKIKDPIFINLRYRLNGVNEADVYPRSLPDFYKNAEFTLFGTYRDEDRFSMQLLGDTQLKTKELIFQRALSEAEKGGPDIMRGYAFNRIYHLISRMTAEGTKPELVREVEGLSRRYGITTPYSPELEKTD